MNTRPAFAFDHAADYEALAEPLTAQVAAAAWERAGVPAGARVLDVAAGTGALALLAALHSAHVVATDLSEPMVARLRERAAAARIALDARVMDGQALDLPDGSFDAAFSVFGVFLFPDWRRGFAELARVVRPGGRVVATSWADPRGAAPGVMMREAMLAATGNAPAMPDGVVALADPAGLAAACAGAGLRDVVVERVAVVWRAPSAHWFAAEAARFFRWMPAWRDMEESARAAVNEALLAAAAAREGPDGLVIESAALVAMGVRPEHAAL